MAPSAASLDAFHRDLEGIVGSRRLSTASVDRTSYSRDMWARPLLAIRDGAVLEHQPHMVVWPRQAQEVVEIVKAARVHRVPVVPFGGGSGVCGGVVPLRGGVTVDLKRMTGMSAIARDEMIVDVEAGLNGERFERALNHRGFTLGHFPSSIYCSTVGGWLATRAAGQMSTKYGKIEDLVAGITFVTGRGELIHTDELARAASGPNWTQLIVGSEGTFGIITSARLRVSLAPQLRLFRGYEFDDVGAGIEAIRRVMQRGLRPAVVRLYDEVDTFVHTLGSKDDDRDASERADHLAPIPEPGSGALPALMPRRDEQRSRRGLLGRALDSALSGGNRERGFDLRRSIAAAALTRPRLVNGVASAIAERLSRKGCLMIVGCEGSRIRTEVEARIVFSELSRAGGKDLGEEPGRQWFEHRYSVSYNMSKAFYQGAFVDTMEVASTWERLLDMYDAVKEAIGRHAAVMAHFSHAYNEGCSIYFSFLAHADNRAAAERKYDAIWRDGMAAATRAGGTISHHHGVGLLKADAMRAEHRESLAILTALKASFDPDNIMNPGKMGLSADGDQEAS